MLCSKIHCHKSFKLKHIAHEIVPHFFREVDARLPGNGNSTSHGARPVHLNITMIVDSD